MKTKGTTDYKSLEELNYIENKINEVIKTSEKYKGCYFWTVSLSASQRRAKEFEKEEMFEFGRKIYRIQQNLSISCKNYYYTQFITVDDEKKDIRVLKSVLKKIELLKTSII